MFVVFESEYSRSRARCAGNDLRNLLKKAGHRVFAITKDKYLSALSKGELGS